MEIVWVIGILIIAGLIGLSIADQLRKEAKNSEDISNLVEKNEALTRALVAQEEASKNFLVIQEDLSKQNKALQNELENVKAAKKKLFSQKKSSETRLGKISENLVPFLEGCPYDPQNMVFLAQPLDYIVFDYEDPKIIFLEVKSGGSQESKRQRILKNAIKKGLVYYESLRINEKGVILKREENNE